MSDTLDGSGGIDGSGGLDVRLEEYVGPGSLQKLLADGMQVTGHEYIGKTVLRKFEGGYFEGTVRSIQSSTFTNTPCAHSLNFAPRLSASFHMMVFFMLRLVSAVTLRTLE